MYKIPQTDLPVEAIVSDVTQHFQTNETLIVKADTGAGKSTVLPLSFLNEDWLEGKKIVLLEPRRLAAKSIAMRMAELLGESVGKTVGYRIRFETKISEETRIEVVTEGILTRMLQSDNAIEEVALVIFDEFHERSIHADMALALCREAQQILRPDLRILVMSATMDLPKLASLLEAKTIESQGRKFPVEVKYGHEADVSLLPELTAKTTLQAIKETDGDILVFLPGQREINRCKDILMRETSGIQIHALYGMLPFKAQQAAILPDKQGRRKIVIATSIAETSLTIKGISTVVDCGYTRTSKFNPRLGLSRLETVPISVDAADQRTGRAGRLREGTCYRMWSKVQHGRMQQHHKPEIEDADLCSLVLELAVWGVENINQLAWLSPPPQAHVQQATDILHELGALENGQLTEHGKEIHKLPCHPRIAHMLIESQDMEQEALATDIATIIEERDVMPREAGVDLTLRIEALRRFRERKGKGKFAMIEKVANSYRQLLKIEEENDSFDYYQVGLLLAYAFPERIAYARPGNNAQFQLANGKIASFSHQDELAHEAWLAVAHIDGREGMGKIFLAAPLDPRDLAPMVKEGESIFWDDQKDAIVAQKELKIGRIILKSSPIHHPNQEQVAQAICDFVKKRGEHILNFSEEVQQWQNRVFCARQWTNDTEYPEVTTEQLLATCEKWLSPYLTNIRKIEELEKLDLLSILEAFLPYDKQQELNEIAPKKWKVPSGSMIKLQYFNDGKAPIMKVRLQELFGLSESPKVNLGKESIVLHLLSPGFKPVQVTSDLVSFWDNTYHEVKKELKRRYPKHEWPENPWLAEAVRGVKRRK